MTLRLSVAADVMMAGAPYRALVPLFLAAQGRCVCLAMGHAAVSLSAAAAAAVVILHSLLASSA